MIMMLLVLNACTKTAPEQVLRQTIEDMQQAGAQKDVQVLMNSFADDFVGSEGMSRDEFRRYVSLIWLRHKDIGIQMGPLEVELFDDRATVNFTVALSGGQGLIPDQGQIYQVQTGWRLDGDEWLIISATWKPVL
jgi:ketosteroid isomerase-like protein